MFDIVFYNNAAEANRVDKASYLSNATTFTGTLREECSLIRPEILVEASTVPNFNYCYIASFDRYYFVTSISSVRNDLWRVSLNCDVLMSYKSQILALDVVLARQENEFNPDLNDPLLPCESEPDVRIIDIPSTVFDVTTALSKKYLLTVIGAA